jgi:hypothetical protein
VHRPLVRYGVRPSRSKVELYAAIRRAARAGKSARAIQRRDNSAASAGKASRGQIGLGQIG